MFEQQHGQYLVKQSVDLSFDEDDEQNPFVQQQHKHTIRTNPPIPPAIPIKAFLLNGNVLFSGSLLPIDNTIDGLSP